MSALILRFAFFVILAYFLLIVYLIKKKKFLLRYGILWLMSGLVMLVFILFPNILHTVTGIFGIELASNGIFAMCIFLVIMILVFLTVIVTDFANRINKLAHRSDIFEKRLGVLDEWCLKREKYE